MCSTDHTVDIIDISATVVDTLASSFEHMERSDLIDKVIEKLENIRIAEPFGEGAKVKEDADSTGSPLHSFLLSGRVLVVDGAMTNWEDFKNAFDKYIRIKKMSYTLSTSELAPFQKLGYNIVKKKMCTICRKPSSKGCCEGYSKANRVERTWITDMEIVCEEM